MLQADTITKSVEEKFGSPAAVVASAPGRLEILGNHTDYNGGVVLSTAVDRRAYFGLCRNNESAKCCVEDVLHGDSRTFDLRGEEGATFGGADWGNYVKGVVSCLLKRGIDVPPFNACLMSDVPLAAGMSSSAALEMAVAYGVLALSNQSLHWQEIARVGQEAENKYVGAQTGLLDQYSSIKGASNKFVFCDFETLEAHTVPVPSGVALLVANSRVKHSLTNEYNERREHCERAVSFLNACGERVANLRHVSLAMLNKYEAQMDSVTYHRALHVVEENQRVTEALDLLENGDLERFGQSLYASHESSRENFENSTQELDLLVDLSRQYNGVYGARLSGGGFGGITVHLLPDGIVDQYSEFLKHEYTEQTGVEPDIIACHAAEGASAEYRF